MLRLLLAVQLVYVVNQVHFPIHTGIPGVVPANLLFLLTLLAVLRKRDTLRFPTCLRWPLLCFFAVLTWAFLWAQIRAPRDLMADITYLKNALFYPLFYFLYAKCRQDEKRTRQLIVLLLVIAAVAGLEALREGLDYGFGRYNPTRRASGPFGTGWQMANRAGVFFSIFMPMFVSLALFLRREFLGRIAAAIAAAVIAGGVLATYSRQSYLLVALSVTVLLLRRSVFRTLVFAAIVVPLLVAYLPAAVYQRVDQTTRVTDEGEQQFDDSTAGRWELWGGALSMVEDNPLGVGLNRFRSEIGSYYEHGNLDAHNFYILTLAECGPHGLLALLFLMWALLRLARALRRAAVRLNPEHQALALGFTMATVCVALGSVYGSPTLEGSVMAPYWALCGLMERRMHITRQQSGQAPDDSGEPSIRRRFPLAATAHPDAAAG